MRLASGAVLEEDDEEDAEDVYKACDVASIKSTWRTGSGHMSQRNKANKTIIWEMSITKMFVRVKRKTVRMAWSAEGALEGDCKTLASVGWIHTGT